MDACIMVDLIFILIKSNFTCLVSQLSTERKKNREEIIFTYEIVFEDEMLKIIYGKHLEQWKQPSTNSVNGCFHYSSGADAITGYIHYWTCKPSFFHHWPSPHVPELFNSHFLTHWYHKKRI